MTNLIKLVRQTPDGLASCVMGQPGLEQIYPPRQWIEACVGGFFAFDSLAPAIQFRDRYFAGTGTDYAQLWSATGDGILPTPTYNPGAFAGKLWIEGFWNAWTECRRLTTTCVATWPNTIIVKRIRLNERIDLSEIGQ